MPAHTRARREKHDRIVSGDKIAEGRGEESAGDEADDLPQDAPLAGRFSLMLHPSRSSALSSVFVLMSGTGAALHCSWVVRRTAERAMRARRDMAERRAKEERKQRTGAKQSNSGSGEAVHAPIRLLQR